MEWWQRNGGRDRGFDDFVMDPMDEPDCIIVYHLKSNTETIAVQIDTKNKVMEMRLLKSKL